ncbi:hypothetical protein [Halobacteriovorax sp. JY17]|uniref:hypothetical protein n=1 Tax=Halobacteriovorax sp. JY17 TaxID=2014617 RepID=UPI000C61BFF3|nr:hypothetical protein [Halobacteriovorax sp. JY17]PIK16106.1 MAG: hypothetical protein CES88_05070 [Halobacteriovorax sp. JY17]
MKKLLITLFMLCSSSYVLACEAIAPEQMNIAISSEYEQEIFYTAEKILSSAAYSSISNCKLTAAKRRYIMLALGVEDLVLNNKNKTYSLSEDGIRRQCSIINSDLKNPISAADQGEEIALKREFLNKCLVVKVTELGPGGLQIPENQAGCDITRISQHAADFTGRFCYFKPGFNSNISVELGVTQKCKTVEGLKELGVTAKDFNGILNIYTSDSATGKNSDLVAIGGSELRISVNPIAELVKPADDFGVLRPVFPSEFNVSEIHLAEPEVRSRGRLLEFKFPTVVDTRCERKCSGGLCSSPCDYAQPIIAEHTLEVFTEGQWEYLTSWYDGAVAPGQWQGILYGAGRQIEKGVLEANSNYRVRIEYREPNFDFKYFDGDITRRLFLNNNNIGGLSSRGRIGFIPLIHTIVNGQTIPLIDIIGQLDFDGSLDGVDRSLRTLQSYLNNKYWPPLYEKICSDKGSCIENGNKFLEFTVNFKLKEEDRKYSLENLKFSKKSFYGDDYTARTIEAFPSIKCSR